EATRSVGLAERLRAEKANPQADVWWSNEPFHTINLAKEGVLAEYDSPAANDVPERFKDANHRWASSGLRARVLAVRKGSAARGLADLLAAPPGKAAMARPSAGTTGGHAAALYAVWGDDKAREFFRNLRQHQ